MLYAKAVMEVVFSAHAEVVPADAAGGVGYAGILRARGGSSVYQAIKSGKIQYSPRTRR